MEMSQQTECTNGIISVERKSLGEPAQFKIWAAKTTVTIVILCAKLKTKLYALGATIYVTILNVISWMCFLPNGEASQRQM